MNAVEFAKNFYLEKKSLLDLYFDSQSKTEVSNLIEDLQLESEKLERLKQILNGVLTDAFYTILLGLEGSTSIGNSNQEQFQIIDEEGNLLSECGELEAEAFEFFHGHKFEIMNSDCDFVATLTYRTTEKGGRKTPAKTGYRSQVKFNFEEMETSGQQTFINREVAFPGDTIEALIKIISVDYFMNKLNEGMTFEFREGSTIIGTGIITRIVNDKLKKASR
jgi:hypothetical protein